RARRRPRGAELSLTSPGKVSVGIGVHVSAGARPHRDSASCCCALLTPSAPASAPGLLLRTSVGT
ncbi:hypothetical protein P7K49_005943, partial [Saguinus oedipus]